MSQTLFLLYRPGPARPMSKTKSVGAHSICARRSLSYRKRARADMESAPTFLWRAAPRTEAASRVEFSPFVESEIRRGAFYMRPRKFALPQAGTGGYGIRPYVFCGGRSPRAEAVPRNGICRGAFYMRPRRFILPQAGTGGYGIRPYVFCGGRSPRTEGAKGRVFACCACKRIYLLLSRVCDKIRRFTQRCQ